MRRAIGLARAALRAGWSAEEVGQRAAEASRLTRRQLLGGSGLAAVSALQSGCLAFARPSASQAEVVVVGAGLAGLCCARRLQQAGVAVRVIEAQERVGGRVYSLRGHFPENQVAELGGELIDSGHLRMRRLAAELGLGLEDYSREPAELARARWYFAGQLRSEREVVDAFMPIAAAIGRDLAALGDAALDSNHPAAVALDRLSLRDWFDTRGVSGWLRSLLEVAYTTEMGLAPEEQSALNLLTFISSQPDPFQVFGDSDERFHVSGGNDGVVRALARPLAGAIEPGSALESVRATPGGDFELSVRRGAGSRSLRTRQLVLSLPLSLLRRVELQVELPALQRRAIAESAYGTNAKLLIGFTRRAWREGAGSDGSTFTDLPYQSTWDSSRQQVGETAILTNFVGGARGIEIGRGSAREQADAALPQLERVMPGSAAARAHGTELRFHWPSHAWTQGSYVCLRPGDWTSLAGALARPSGGLHFAGEHCSQDHQGFMEGACESGERAADAVLAQLGLRAVRPAALAASDRVLRARLARASRDQLPDL